MRAVGEVERIAVVQLGRRVFHDFAVQRCGKAVAFACFKQFAFNVEQVARRCGLPDCVECVVDGGGFAGQFDLLAVDQQALQA